MIGTQTTPRNNWEKLQNFGNHAKDLYYDSITLAMLLREDIHFQAGARSTCVHLKDITKGAFWGAAKGAELGIKVNAFALGAQMLFYTLESTNRSILGNEPHWPIYIDDCELEEFKPYCVETSTLAGVVLVLSPTLLGIGVGATTGAAYAIFKKIYERKPAAINP